MVEIEKKEQRGQAVKRLRSLFDMHHVAFGAPENLGGVILSLHEDRHFAMDFWAVVGALTSGESGALSDEEMLETVIESATGTESAALPEHEQSGVRELQQLLAGVDVARPIELPDAISEPGDALLPRQRRSAENGARPMRNEEVHVAEEAHVARRSIGETLARLEETSRELREQLASIDQAGNVTAAPAEKLPAAAPAISQAGAGDASEQIAAIPAPRATLARDAAKIRETEVFAPRPAHTLSQRGLAMPEPDDDPRIVAPLSGYMVERSPAARFAVAVLVIAVLGAGSFFAARTDRGHALLGSAGSSLYAAYRDAGERLGLLKSEAAAPSVQAANATNGSDTTPTSATPTNANSAAVEAPASGTPTVESAVESTPGSAAAAPSAPAAVATRAPSVTEPQTATVPPTPSALPKRRTEDIGTTRPRPVEIAVDTSVLRVSASTMAANLVASRVPAYPEAAKAQDIEGSVVMEVVVAESGMVKRVRAIDGDRHLRAAAEDAVMKWRYRPYLLNGSPVEVSTTVRVDFRLPR
jgi:TonB family protein